MSDETIQAIRGETFVREHLSNERTFLAWIRTALALMGFGVLIARLRWIIPASVHHGAINALNLGLSLSVLGLVTVVFSLWHYFSTRRALDNNCYRSAGASILLLGVLIVIAGIGIIIYLFNSPPGIASAAVLP